MQTAPILSTMTTRILLVDDDISFQKLLERKLKSLIADSEFVHCASLAEVRAILSPESFVPFDIIFLDQHLPDGLGYSFLNELGDALEKSTVIAMSSDANPELPGENVKAGAAYFISKTDISQPLFAPLFLGLIERAKLLKELESQKLDATVIETVKTLVATLQHEINNPLGAVLGAVYLLRLNEGLTEEQKKAAELVESSGKRIKHVLDQLRNAVDFETVSKSNQDVFHIPGDPKWES